MVRDLGWRVRSSLDAHLSQVVGHDAGLVAWRVVLVQVPPARLEQIRPLSTKPFPELFQYLYIVLLVHRLTFGNPVDVYHALYVEEGDQHQLPR